MDIVSWVQRSIVVYVASISVIYFALMTLGFFALRHRRTRLTKAQLDAVMRAPQVPAVTVIAPAYNEGTTIRDSVRSMLSLEYPYLTVVVVNDGSTDGTLAALIEEFRLYRSSRWPSNELTTAPIRGVYESLEPLDLIVVDKENGGKADAINAGIRLARTPLVAAVDADSLLESTAILSVTKPFLDDETTIATGGIVRVANGCDVRHGQVTRIAAPRRLLPSFQVVEYLRAFLGGRVALSFMNALLLISGAFGMFRRDAVVEAGGFLTTTVGEDMELVIRLHHRWGASGRPYRIVFVPDPVCWTEVPERLSVLQRQRNRWQRGTAQSLWEHRRLLLNPRYGWLGLFAVPYFALFEMLGPCIELLGYAVTLVGLGTGVIATNGVLLFFVVAVVYGMLLSVGSVLLENLTVRRYPSPADVAWLTVVAIDENLGYRQIMTVWRSLGLLDAVRGKTGWGRMERKGFRRPG